MSRHWKVPALLAGLVLCAGSASAQSATHLEAANVAAAFAKGAPLIEVGAYKIHASRREAPGMVEIHQRDTDIVYVLEGEATLMVGGRATDAMMTAVDELRGNALEGGEAHTLVKGDVIVVPAGTPHWFRAVRGPFLYYVVKVTAPAAGVSQ